VARCPMERAVLIGSGGVVVSAYGIAGTKALPFQGGFENSDKPPRDLEETAHCALIACGGGVEPAALEHAGARRCAPSMRWPGMLALARCLQAATGVLGCKQRLILAPTHHPIDRSHKSRRGASGQ
jgi:hypothetical protein